MFLFLTHNRIAPPERCRMWWQGKGRSTQRGSTLGSTDGMLESCLHGQNIHGQNIHVTYVKAFIAKAVGVTESAHRRSVSNRCVCCLAPHYICPLQPHESPDRWATTCHIRSHVYMWWSCVGCCYMYLHPSPLMSPVFVGLTKLTLVTARQPEIFREIEYNQADMPTATLKLYRTLLVVCVTYSHAFLLLHRGALYRREYIKSRCIILAQEAMAPADEGGPFAGPFWDALCNEAREEAEELGLTITKMSYASGKLSVLASGGGLDELQALNTHLSSFVDEQDEATMEALPPFLLEVSSPGLSSILTTDLDFSAFKGFPVTATTTEPFKDKTVWEGTLVGRDDEFVTINLKGRLVKLPRSIVGEVALPKSKREPGDPYS